MPASFAGMVEREPTGSPSRSFLLRVDLSKGEARYFVCDLRTGECRRFANSFALQRFLALLKRVHRLQ